MIEEYLAMKDKKIAKQSMNSSFKKLWHLADEDDEEGTYVFGKTKHEFITTFHQNSWGLTNHSFESHSIVLICSLDTFEEEYKVESEVFDLLKIDVNLFTCNTPLRNIFNEFSQLSSMEDDLYTYDVGVLEPSYFPFVEQPYDDLKNGNLDIYKP
nr:hypothetical protein [Tanacetum cinerariifolium]